MDKEEPKQLRLAQKDQSKATHSGGQGKREKEEKGNKWVVITILIVSVFISLVFYLSGRKITDDQTPVKIDDPESQLGGVKVYNF